MAEVVPEEFPPSKCDNREALTNDSLDQRLPHADLSESEHHMWC